MENTNKIKRIEICPNCGADCRHIDPTDLKNYVCESCGYELYDHSREIFDEKIEDVKEKKKQMQSVIPKAAIIVTAILAGIMLIGILFFVFGMDSKLEIMKYENASDKMTKKMEKAYENEDYDKLYEIVIEDVENSIGSPYYYAYRTAWFLHEYPEQFDTAISSGDTKTAKFIYDTIKSDYNFRNDFFDTWYESFPDIEEALVKEYERETKIMEAYEQ